MLFLKNLCLILFGLLTIVFVVCIEKGNEFVKQHEKFKAKLLFKFQIIIMTLGLILLIIYSNL